MSELVLYRKYRPKHFDEIIRQEHVVTALTNSVRMGRIAHAYLFSGPRGIGKTTIARLMAKALNCGGKDVYEVQPHKFFKRSLDTICRFSRMILVSLVEVR